MEPTVCRRRTRTTSPRPVRPQPMTTPPTSADLWHAARREGHDVRKRVVAALGLVIGMAAAVINRPHRPQECVGAFAAEPGRAGDMAAPDEAPRRPVAEEDPREHHRKRDHQRRLKRGRAGVGQDARGRQRRGAGKDETGKRHRLDREAQARQEQRGQKRRRADDEGIKKGREHRGRKPPDTNLAETRVKKIARHEHQDRNHAQPAPFAVKPPACLLDREEHRSPPLGAEGQRNRPELWPWRAETGEIVADRARAVLLSGGFALANRA